MAVKDEKSKEEKIGLVINFMKVKLAIWKHFHGNLYDHQQILISIYDLDVVSGLVHHSDLRSIHIFYLQRFMNFYF